ncbi:MAG: TonB-dependent receptor plug domain-containing protein, partial [Steroidobacteraceae bacterium]
MVVTSDVAAKKISNRFAFKGIPPALLLAIAFGLGGNVSRAADPPATIASPTELEEVIVTAQKREQNEQDVPISVIALSGQQLQDAGVTNIKNLAVLTPGITVTSTTSENSTTARIRGIG